MQVGLSCLVIPGDWKLTDILSKTKAAGYEALELVLRDEGEITLSTPDATLASLAAQAKDAGMYLASVCPSLPVSAPNLKRSPTMKPTTAPATASPPSPPTPTPRT